jgi:HTH-type transcriptional regulator/antitoxin HigA
MTTLPNYLVGPGDFITEWMEDEGINAAELARRLGVSQKHVSELRHGQAPLSQAIALDLERVTGVPARRWNQMEALYQEDRVRLAERARLADDYDRVAEFPLAYLRKLGFVRSTARDKAAVVEEVLRFFRLGDISAWDKVWGGTAIAYRQAARASDKPEHMSAWLRAGELTTPVKDLPPYDEEALRSLIPKLRHLTRGDPRWYIGQVVNLMADVGVALAFVPEVPGLGVHGATRWIHGHPLIQLSLRGKKDDQLWFTLFHEIGHLLLHRRDAIYVAEANTSAEREADEFAADSLIPPELAEDLPGRRRLGEVTAFAERIGIAPGVVIGRIQRLTGDFSWGNRLKQDVVIDLPRVARRGFE